jgi:hypothetical protein
MVPNSQELEATAYPTRVRHWSAQPASIARTGHPGSPRWLTLIAAMIAPIPPHARTAPKVPLPACSTFLTTYGSKTCDGPKNSNIVSPAATSVRQSHALARTN